MAKSIEERLNDIELELAKLKTRVTSPPPKRSWIETITGSFRNRPEFDEVLRLGRELRQNERAHDH